MISDATTLIPGVDLIQNHGFACKQKKCLLEWERYYIPNFVSTEEDEYIFTHCEIDDCHELYWKSKNGLTCIYCGLEICEKCIKKSVYGQMLNDEWVCKSCTDDIIKNINVVSQPRFRKNL
jgi:hypothetical protein